jgi:hypothetical protein
VLSCFAPHRCSHAPICRATLELCDTLAAAVFPAPSSPQQLQRQDCVVPGSGEVVPASPRAGGSSTPVCDKHSASGDVETANAISGRVGDSGITLTLPPNVQQAVEEMVMLVGSLAPDGPDAAPVQLQPVHPPQQACQVLADGSNAQRVVGMGSAQAAPATERASVARVPPSAAETDRVGKGHPAAGAATVSTGQPSGIVRVALPSGPSRCPPQAAATGMAPPSVPSRPAAAAAGMAPPPAATSSARPSVFQVACRSCQPQRLHASFACMHSWPACSTLAATHMQRPATPRNQPRVSYPVCLDSIRFH